MRYFIRTFNVSGNVEELEYWNGPYGFDSPESAKEEIQELVDDSTDAFLMGELESKYVATDFFIEEVDLFLPDGSAD